MFLADSGFWCLKHLSFNVISSAMEFLQNEVAGIGGVASVG